MYLRWTEFEIELLICIKRIWHEKTYNSWYAIKQNHYIYIYIYIYIYVIDIWMFYISIYLSIHLFMSVYICVYVCLIYQWIFYNLLLSDVWLKISHTHTHTHTHIYIYKENYIYFLKISYTPRGVMVKALDCGIVVNEFKFQSYYCVQYRTNTLGKDMDPLYPQLRVKQYHYFSSR